MLLGNNYLDLDRDGIIEVNAGTTSKGNQQKFYDTINKSYIKLAFRYQDKEWKDYMVEHLSWRLSTMTDTLGIQIIKQDIVNTKMGYACVSKDFTNGDYEFVSIYKLMRGHVPWKEHGKSFRIYNTLVKFVNDNCNIDITDYLVVMIIFDCLLLNEDRHYNNFGVLFNGEFKVAPLFDFGLGLFEHDKMYNNCDLQKALSLCTVKPFDRNPFKPVEMLLNIGLIDKVTKVVAGIRVPSKVLFPNELGYEYFNFALERLRELCSI